MVAKDFEIKNTIISYLRHNELGASASDIAKEIGFNRITVGKYLQVLQAEKLVSSKRVASAIYWQLAQYSKKPKVLIVDDEKHIVDLIRLSLAPGRYDIYEAYDGLEAMAMVGNIFPDIIVLDLMMPKLNGFEVCEKLKSNILTQNIPILILSAKGEVSDKVELMKLGADDYIVKPFDPLELEARVANKLSKMQINFSKNSITNLPSEIITQENFVLWKTKSEWYEIMVEISNFDDFVNHFGHKKAYDVLKMFSRLLLEIFNGSPELFFGHLADNKIGIFSPKDIDSKLDEIKLRFKQMVPFFYPDFSESFANFPDKITLKNSNVIHNVLTLNVERKFHD